MMAGEYHDDGGADPSALVGDGPHGPMVGSASMSVHDGLVVRTTLDPTEQPFLDDHRIDGTPVLPGVMGMEAFAEAARLAVPDLDVVAVENVAFSAPLKFFRDEPRELTVRVVATPEGDEVVARCSLSAERLLPGSDTPQRTVHFTGTVRLGTADGTADGGVVEPGAPDGPDLAAERVYAFYFHGPAYQVVDSGWRSQGASVSRMLVDGLPDNHVPTEAPLLTAPRLAELCFQTAGLWLAGRDGVLGLPMAVGRVSLVGDPGTGGLRCVMRQVADGEFEGVVVDDQDQVVMRMDGYRTVELPAPIPDDVGADLNATYGD